MFAKITLITMFLVGVNCLYISQSYERPILYVEDRANIIADDLEDLYSKQLFETVQPVHVRERRQVHGVMNTNPDGTSNIMAKLPLAGNDKNKFSAVGGLESIKPGGSFGAGSAGLALDNVNGHGLSLTGKHIPDKANQLTAAGKFNFVNTDKHDFSANAFATRTMPNNPVIPNFNTYGGGLDYMFDKKVGASVGVAHTPLWDKTDYSAMGKFNLFHDRSSSLDFNAGASKSVSPFIPKSSWEPNFGLSFSKYF